MSLPQELEAWVCAHVEPTDGLDLVHERPWGDVWRVPVSGGAAWLKVCGAVQAFEPGLTAALAARWPALLPEVLACDEARAWLLLGDAGNRLGFSGTPEPWLAVLPAYAELQRGEVAHAAAHVTGGVPDGRIATFPMLYQAMLGRELPLAADDVARLRAFEPRFGTLCDELMARGVPDTIQHHDLHGNNVYFPDGTTRILDWGDACVSHPFVTLFVTFLHLEELGGLPHDDPWFARLRDAYLEPWGRSDELRETFELAQRIGAFAYVFKQLHVLDAIPELDRRFVRDLPNALARCAELAA